MFQHSQVTQDNTILRLWQSHSTPVPSDTGQELVLDQFGPLPVHPQDEQHGYRIVDRVHGQTGFQYEVANGEQRLFVDVETVTDFVSPLQLEAFETQRFTLEQQQIAFMGAQRESDADSIWSSNSESSAAEPMVFGKHGRPRPSYAKQLISWQAWERKETKRATAKNTVEDSAVSRRLFGSELRQPAVRPEAASEDINGDRTVQHYDRPEHTSQQQTLSESLSPQQDSQGQPQQIHTADVDELETDGQQSSDRGPTLFSADAQFDDGEICLVDAILDHRLSDPDMHPPGFGREPIMLYQVRWQDQQTTWEPRGNFAEELINEYHQKSRRT